MRNRSCVPFYTSGTFGNSSCMDIFAYNRLILRSFPYNPPVLLLYKLLETFIKEWEEGRVTVLGKLISPPWSREILCCECLYSPNSFVGEAAILGSVLRKLKTDAERNEDRNGFHSPTYNTASHFVPAFPKMLCAPWYRSDAWIVLPAVSAPHTVMHEDVAAPSSLWLWHFAKTVLYLYHCLWCGTPG